MLWEHKKGTFSNLNTLWGGYLETFPAQSNSRDDEKMNGIYPEGRGGDCRGRVDRESHFRETGTTAIRLCF